MPRLDTLTLRVTDPEAQRGFYRDVLGMTDAGDGRLAYSDEEAAIQFAPANTPYAPQPSDLYWKIALSVPDIELAWRQLEERGVNCSEPQQFLDVGFLAHFTDPEGFKIELIDHHFEGERPEVEVDQSRLGGGARLNLVTLRSGNIEQVEPQLIRIGMTPLSIQPVEPHGFTLYFYGFADEEPPNPDLTAIENRTWVYQRPYTVLEIQHVPERDITHEAGTAAGYQQLSISRADPTVTIEQLGLMARET